MDKYFTSLRNMFGAVQLVILEFIAEWTGYAPYETANTEFNDFVAAIDETAVYQQTDIKGYAKEKKLKRATMASIVVIVSKKIRALAAAKNDQVLMKEMQIARTKMTKGRAVKALYYGEQVVTALSNLSPAEKTAYHIDAAQEALLIAGVAEFKKVLTAPRTREAQRKTATEKLVKLFRAANTVLIEKLDNLMENYAGTPFYDDYKNARIIVNQIRHTVIRGNVTAPGGADLNKVKVKLTGKEKLTGNEVLVFEEMTDKDGNFEKSALNPELSWDVEFVLTNYVPQKISDIDLERGTIDILDVTLVPVV